MLQPLIDQLSQLTEEETAILGGIPLARETYTDNSRFVVSSKKLLPPRQMITLRRHTRLTAFPPHSHDYVEILYMLSGQTVHDLPGGETVTLKAGELLLINCDTVHAIHSCTQGDIGVNFIVQPEFFDDALAAVGSSNVLGHFLLNAIRRGGDETPFLVFRVADMPAIQSAMASMLYARFHEPPCGQRILKQAMTLLFLLLVEHTDALTMPASREDQLVVGVLDYIQHNYANLSFRDYAAENHVSSAYLSRCVRHSTGETCTALLQRRRLAQARKLLRETNLTVSEICGAVGYTDTGHFYQLFHRETGLTPDAYRDVNSGR